MAKQKQAVSQGRFWAELFQFGLYKPNQGRIVRQVTFLAIAIVGCLAAYQFSRMGWAAGMFSGSRYLFLVLFGALGLWIAYRIVNYSKFADFLIAVEAEMNKVSWPTKQELWKASLVVIFVIFALAALMFLFDIVWTKIFEVIGIRYMGE